MAKKAFRFLLALLFISSGVAHFAMPKPFVDIVPPFLPAPLMLVWISGVAEIAGGVGLLVPFLRRWAGIGLVVLLIAVYPANIYMALYNVPFGDTPIPWWGHLIRLPLQFVMLGLVVWVADLWPAKTASADQRQ